MTPVPHAADRDDVASTVAAARRADDATVDSWSGVQQARRVAGAMVVAWIVLVLAMTALGLVVTKGLFGHEPTDRDEAISRWFVEHRTPTMNTVTEYATYVGNTEGILLVAALAIVVLVVQGRRSAAWWIALALLLELTVFLAANAAVDRARPPVERLNATPSTDSFPSGHCAATTVLYGILAFLVVRGRWPRIAQVAAIVAAALVVAMVGFARAYRGMHHISDVLAGALLGALAIAAARQVVRFSLVGGSPSGDERRRGQRWS